MNNINAGSWQSEANCRGKMTVTNKMNMSQKGKPTDKEQSARNESQQGSSSKARFSLITITIISTSIFLQYKFKLSIYNH